MSTITADELRRRELYWRWVSGSYSTAVDKLVCRILGIAYSDPFSDLSPHG